MSESRSHSELSPPLKKHNDRASDDFESKWTSKPRPRIETYLGDLRELDHSRCLRELLLIELQLRPSKEDMPNAIADDAMITVLVRQRATELAGPFADNFARSCSQ